MNRKASYIEDEMFLKFCFGRRQEKGRWKILKRVKGIHWTGTADKERGRKEERNNEEEADGKKLK